MGVWKNYTLTSGAALATTHAETCHYSILYFPTPRDQVNSQTIQWSKTKILPEELHGGTHSHANLLSKDVRHMAKACSAQTGYA